MTQTFTRKLDVFHHLFCNASPRSLTMLRTWKYLSRLRTAPLPRPSLNAILISLDISYAFLTFGYSRWRYPGSLQQANKTRTWKNHLENNFYGRPVSSRYPMGQGWSQGHGSKPLENTCLSMCWMALVEHNKTYQGRLMQRQLSFDFALPQTNNICDLHLILDTDDPMICCHTGAHSPPTGQGWELQLQVTIDHPQCSMSKLWMAIRFYCHWSKYRKWKKCC